MNFKDFVEFNDSVMVKHFNERMDKHIGLVNKYVNIIVDAFPEFNNLTERVKVHDDSKFKFPELEPYVYITWSYKCKDDGVEFEIPDGMSDKMAEATTHHVLNNRHHPEFHSGEDSDIINTTDRDSPVRDKIIDATSMPDIDIAEMCADWCAVSEERGNTPQEWAKSNIGVRWEFNDHQTSLIYDILDTLWTN